MSADLEQFWQPLDLLRVDGDDRVGHLQRLSSQNLQPLAEPGLLAETLFLTPQGRLVDWVTVAASAGQLALAASPGRGGRLAEWIRRYTITERVAVCVEPAARWWRLLLLGPGALAAVGRAALPAPGRWEGDWDQGIWRAPLAAFGAGLEAWMPQEQVEVLRRRLAVAGAVVGNAPTLERRRLAAGVPSSAYEFADPVNPLELRLGALAVGWNKGCYIGQEVVSRLDNYQKVARLLVGFTAAAVLPAAPTAKIVRGDAILGRVTSHSGDSVGTIGLALVKQSAAAPQPVELMVGEARIPAELTLPPFCAQPVTAEG